MNYRLLGPLEVADEQELPLGRRKQRALLARLLLDAGRTVPTERLIDDLWGEDVPDTAVKMVQISVSGLRKVLPADVLRTRAPGYSIELGPQDELDLHRFERLAAAGRAALAAGDPAAAADQLREALALWRGSALAEFEAEPFARPEGDRLEELRLVALEDRIDADLELGRATDLAGELEALTTRHPLRERLRGQLMLALYRAGRQGEALAAYHAFRATLDTRAGDRPVAAAARARTGDPDPRPHDRGPPAARPDAQSRTCARRPRARARGAAQRAPRGLRRRPPARARLRRARDRQGHARRGAARRAARRARDPRPLRRAPGRRRGLPAAARRARAGGRDRARGGRRAGRARAELARAAAVAGRRAAGGPRARRDQPADAARADRRPRGPGRTAPGGARGRGAAVGRPVDRRPAGRAAAPPPSGAAARPGHARGARTRWSPS